jgi:ferredoxin-type protein NapH
MNTIRDTIINHRPKRIIILRRIVSVLIFVAVIISLAFDSGLGTPSAFGLAEFSLLCPLGGLETMLASRTFLSVAALSMLVTVALALLFGRAWCAWGCPAPAIRSFFKRELKPPEPVSDSGGFASDGKEAKGKERDNKERDDKETVDAADKARNGSGIVSRLKFLVQGDKRLAVLAAVLITSFIAGFPLFCLICPIGLTFGTVISLWHFFVYKQITLSVLVFPLGLIIELVAYRKWCLNICPIAALLAIIGRGARLFRPRVDATKCLLYTTESECKVCVKVCSESIDLHRPDAAGALRNCTRCAKCQVVCPSQAIDIKVKSGDPVVRP